MDHPAKLQSIYDEIAELERRLKDAKDRLQIGQQGREGLLSSPAKLIANDGPLAPSSHHFLLLLSDSALPLGSFAFSSGLESYIAHTRPISSFPTFLRLSISSYASATLPFMLAAHRNPTDIWEIDDTLDATIMCTVGRRASVTQGRALLSLWDRSFRFFLPLGAEVEIVDVLREFAVMLRGTPINSSADLPTVSAHLAPLFGGISRLLGLTLEQTAYVFILSHVKSLLSAAVRASIFGPYHAQKILASTAVQEYIRRVVEDKWMTKVEEAGQSVPVMDLWIGRHELLYTRIFNS